MCMKMMETKPKVNERSFHSRHYCTPQDANKPRDWLLYSETANSLFCFSCCLFGSQLQCSSWAKFGNSSGGFSTFIYQAKAILDHEQSQAHFVSNKLWKEYVKTSGTIQSLDTELKAEYEREASIWRKVLRSIVHVILYLAQNNLTFRGTSDVIGTPNCGNFLSLVKLFSHYHAPLALHIERMEKRKVSYMSPRIQNEFISLTAQSVRSQIIAKIKGRK